MKDSERRIVCAANRNIITGEIILGIRHFDKFMAVQIRAKNEDGWVKSDQGFVDQQGNFLTREDAHRLAKANNQIYRSCGGDEYRLYSENLY